MFSNLYIRKSIVWGCNAYCGRVSPKAGLLSAAVSDLSVPILVRNLLGLSFDGLDSIDFIRILGLPFSRTWEAFDRGNG